MNEVYLHFPPSRLFRAHVAPKGTPLPYSTKTYMMFLRLSRRMVLEARKFEGFRPAHLLAYTYTGLFNMARYNNQITFCSIRLNNSDKKKFDAWASELQGQETDVLERFAQDHFKVGATYDAERDVFIVSVTGKDGSGDNQNKCFTSRSQSLAEAILISAYKHYELANSGDWDKIVTESSDWG